MCVCVRVQNGLWILNCFFVEFQHFGIDLLWDSPKMKNYRVLNNSFLFFIFVSFEICRWSKRRKERAKGKKNKTIIMTVAMMTMVTPSAIYWGILNLNWIRCELHNTSKKSLFVHRPNKKQTGVNTTTKKRIHTIPIILCANKFTTEHFIYKLVRVFFLSTGDWWHKNVKWHTVKYIGQLYIFSYKFSFVSYPIWLDGKQLKYELRARSSSKNKLANSAKKNEKSPRNENESFSSFNQWTQRKKFHWRWCEKKVKTKKEEEEEDIIKLKSPAFFHHFFCFFFDVGLLAFSNFTK